MSAKNVVYMMKGLPASGKTTHARGMVAQGIKRVSKDDLRAMVDFGEYTPELEIFILEVRDFLVSHAIAKGFDVVVDDTNLNPEHEKVLRYLARPYNADFEVIEMQTSLKECIKRDKERSDSVGEFAIRTMAEKAGIEE